ncbi:MAG: S8 family serine peptidase, partial [Thermoanaerobaculia bacterium]
MQEGARPTPKLDRTLIEQLMFGTGRVRRFTQDSPVLPDVWIEYAKGPGEEEERLTGPAGTKDPFPPVKLLLTPWRESFAGDIRLALRERIASERKRPEWRALGHDPKAPARIIYNQSTVAATLYFEDLVRAVLPMTGWWHQLDDQWNIEGIQTEHVQERLAEAVQDPEHPPLLETGEGRNKPTRLPPALLWMMRVAGALALARRGQPLPPVFHEKDGVARAGAADWRVLVNAIAELIRGVKTPGGEARIYSVSLNREATPTVSRSMLAVKADAARRLFDISCRELAWAIIDSGIDARHPAFRIRKDDKPCPEPFRDGRKTANNTRVVETYDFTQIEEILDPDVAEPPASLSARLKDDPQLERKFKALKKSLSEGGSLDWKLLAPLVRIPHDKDYRAPKYDHGTHVAGILAGDWRAGDPDGILKKENLQGVCPDLRLYDLRVLDDRGVGDEFAVMAALQFVRHLNSTNDYVAVHGVNLSLSIPHDISNYACGRTPVCEECERMVGSGVVVVAAAGNQGYRKYTAPDGVTIEAYNSISITDP